MVIWLICLNLLAAFDHLLPLDHLQLEYGVTECHSTGCSPVYTGSGC